MFIAKYGSLVSINDCSGQNPAILSCQVEMSKVIAATGLLCGDLIKVQVRAINSYSYLEPRLYPDLR